MAIKRNSTAVLEIEIGFPLANIKKIGFIFKKENKSYYPELLHKEYTADEIDIDEKSENIDNGFIMLMKLEPKETFKLTEGVIYMDTQIVSTNGSIIPTEIECIKDIKETLFSEVYHDQSQS